ncbi:MAG TPA: 2OG-Fe(II) oxygenase [Allosphingosinicella sp.]|nr:2OG-Fe(II) oxygenase [Allosphingosinicella sp.]
MPPAHPMLARAFALLEAGRKAEGLLIVNQLAAQGEPEALFTLAKEKWRGIILPQDLAQARQLFRRADEAGHALAAVLCTNLLANGIAGEPDWPGALRRLREEARGNPRRKQILSLVEKMKLDPQGDPLSLPPGRRLSEAPEVTLFPHLFSAAECDYLRQAEPAYRPSMVIDQATGGDVPDPIRTSDGTVIHWLIEDPAIHALNRRLAAASGTSVDQGEPLQILRYRPGQQYLNHFDFVPGAENQRMLSALVYLNDGFKGGETCFVRTGLKVKGRKGDALVFRNLGADRQADPLSEHAGLPVTGGTKFLASRWIRERRHVP